MDVYADRYPAVHAQLAGRRDLDDDYDDDDDSDYDDDAVDALRVIHDLAASHGGVSCD